MLRRSCSLILPLLVAPLLTLMTAPAEAVNACNWSTAYTGAAPDGGVYAMAVFDDGGGPALFVGGTFVHAGGLVVNSIAKLQNGVWSALTGPSGTGVVNGDKMGLGYVYALAVYDDGTGPALYVGGRFYVAGGIPAERIAKWDGSTWSAVTGPSARGIGNPVPTDPTPGIVTAPPLPVEVMALAVYDDGGGAKLYAGGMFGSAGGVLASNLATWDGQVWAPLPSEGMSVGDEVFGMTVVDFGTGPALYVAGSFAMIAGTTVNSIAKWNGSTWSGLSGPAGTGVPPPPTALVETAAGSAAGGGTALYAIGSFVTAGGVTVNRIGKWNGHAWSALSGPAGTGLDSRGLSLVDYPADGPPALYAGGRFMIAGGVTVNRIAKWNGSAWSALTGTSGTGTSGEVSALAVYDDGDGPSLYVGGAFATAGGVSSQKLARWTCTFSIFADGFESGNIGHWSGSVGAP